MKSLTFIEIDLDLCANTYGSSPCTAELGVTGDRKCFNTPRTCQDRANFVHDTPTTMRFAKDLPWLPRDIDCIASLLNVAYTPSVMAPGVSLGQRATLTCTFKNHPHSDTLPNMLDPYLADRAYDPVQQGTFWGKFRARHFFVKGRPLRWIRGAVGQALGDMETRHFVMENVSGPDANGVFTIVAKDILKLADDDRAKAPFITDGFLLSGIDIDDTAATLRPIGIGNLQYPSSGFVCIGGSEVCAFTRSGDSLTLTRGNGYTVARAHNEDERVQLCLLYNADDPADVINNLLQSYAGVSADFIPLTEWTTETATYLQRVVTALITEPTGVRTLLNELIEQCALSMWWDDEAQLIRLQVLRNIPSTAGVFSLDNVMQGTFRVQDQPHKRISSCHTYFGLRDQTRPLDEKANYSASLLTTAAQNESDYGSAQIKTIFSRWIPEFGTNIAERVNNLIIGRYQIPPRLIDFSVFRNGTDMLPLLGGGHQIGHRYFEDDEGNLATVPVQVIQLDPKDDSVAVRAEEVSFVNIDPEDLTNRTITIDTNAQNINIRAIHDTLYPVITEDEADEITLNVVIAGGVLIGSNVTTAHAITIGDWPSGLTINLTLGPGSTVSGAGGRSNNGPIAGNEPTAGGPALLTRFPTNLMIETGATLQGGGGGGGAIRESVFAARGGGGGAGHLPGAGGLAVNGGSSNGAPGTISAGGAPGGGNPGSPGVAGDPDYGAISVPGAAGAAIDGFSYVTVVYNNGSVFGPAIN